MLKTVTCSFSTIKRAADEKGIKLSMAGQNPEADVVLRRVTGREVAVAARSLEGQLFLSLLICGAIG